MGLGLYLVTTTALENPLDAVESHLKTHARALLESLERDEGELTACLHPAAEPIELRWDGQQLLFQAKTSMVGPGYHSYLCELLDGLIPILGASWGPGAEDNEGGGDETGFFASRDEAALEEETLSWLRAVAGVVAEGSEDGSDAIMLSMPTDKVFEAQGALVTPLGPRDTAWVEAVRHDARSGIDLFPWWSRGLGAEHWAGRALCRLWSDVLWRPPTDEEDAELLQRVDEELTLAHELDPSFPLPWPEWAEVLRLLNVDGERLDAVAARAAGAAPSIGYRRRHVRVSLTGGWSIRVPGAMSSRYDEDGTWCGHMPGRTVWMSSFSVGDEQERPLTSEETLPSRLLSGEPVELAAAAAGCARRATLGITDEGASLLSVEIALPHRLAFFSIVTDNDFEWACDVAGSIQG